MTRIDLSRKVGINNRFADIRRSSYFERGVKEAIYIWAYKRYLKKDRGYTNFRLSMTRLLITSSQERSIRVILQMKAVVTTENFGGKYPVTAIRS